MKQLRKDKEDLKIKSSEFESTAAKLKESEELAEKRKITSDNLAKEVIPNPELQFRNTVGPQPFLFRFRN